MKSAPLAPLSPFLLSVLRIVAAFLFVEHGTQKILGYPPAAPHAAAPAAAHAASSLMATLAGASGWIELIGGGLLLIGLLSRIAAFILSGEMAVAYFTAHGPHSIWPILNGGELAALYSFVFLYLAAAGPGPVSIDRLLHRT